MKPDAASYSVKHMPLAIFIAKLYWRYGFRKGRKWLANVISSHLLHDQEMVATLDPGGIRVILNLADPQSMYAIAYGGTLEKSYAKLIFDFLQPGHIFFDVGANFGYYTLTSAARVKPTGKVFSFEPQAEIAGRLQQSVLLNDFDNVTVEQSAVGNKKGILQLHCPINYFSGISSAFTDNLDRVGKEGRVVDVPVISLNDFINREEIEKVDAIKIDVEGFELNVLLGAVNLLEGNNAPVLFLEIVSMGDRSRDRAFDTLKLLNSYGYSVFRIDRKGYSAIKSGAQLVREQNVCAIKLNVHKGLATVLNDARLPQN